MRLVPNQEWEHITELFTKHFMSIAPDSVTVKVTPHHGGQGMWPIDSIGYKAANMAYTETLEFRLFQFVLEEVFYCSFVWKELKAKQS
jgi:hypothetical protein